MKHEAVTKTTKRPLLYTSLIVATFLGVVAGGTAAWWGFPPVALAAGQCNNYLYNDVMRTNGVLHVDRGVKAATEDVVYGGGVQCAHVDSVIVEHPGGSYDYVEVGWATVQSAYTYCDPASALDNTPHPMFAIRVGVGIICTLVEGISIQGGDTPRVAVRSNYPSYPNDWIFYYSGDQIAYAGALPFSTGAGLTNCDRHFMGNQYTTPSDPTLESCQAHFIGMQYRSTDNGGAWADWGSEICSDGQNGTFANMNDPVYYNHLTQPNEVAVSTSSSSPC